MTKINKMNKHLSAWLIIVVILLVISGILPLVSSISILESLRICFGSVYVLFLPGYVISYLFFPKNHEFDSNNEPKGSIDWIERIALSFALSIAIVPLVVFYLNLTGIRISAFNSFIIILGILLISGGILYWKNKKN